MSGVRRGLVRPLSVAPMMDRSDRHFRVFLRCLSRHTLLYTEMVHAQAVLVGDRERLLGFDPEEGPLALQLGGDDPVALAEAARIAEDHGYDEINLNVGCPSSRVQSGNFGVCLMGQPDRVAEAVAAMRSAVSLPVTVKHRIGFDDRDSYAHMLEFVDRVAAAGCVHFTVHARKAWLKGLSPKENRNIPPLRPEEVVRLKAERSHLVIELNGGIRDLDTTAAWLSSVDAVMIGRAAWDDPYLFAEADRRFFGASTPVPRRADVVAAMEPVMVRALERGVRALSVVRPMMGLFSGVPGARAWRRVLSDASQRRDVGVEVLRQALAAVDAARATPRAHVVMDGLRRSGA